VKTSDFNLELERTYQEWQNLLAQIPPERMTIPGAAGFWSVKDIIAHITWGEQEMIGILKQRALVGSPLWEASQTDRNQAVYEQNRDRALPDILAEAGRVHAELWTLCQQLAEGDLDDPARFKNMPLETKPWEYLVGNTYEHYLEHIPSLRDFLKKANPA
jgi:uncharacterized damage-inducible protein DinB